MATSGGRGSYGIDAPTVVVGLLGAAAADVVMWAWRAWSLGPAVGCGVTGLAMLWSSKVGKLRERERLVDSVALRGDERVLDVGCGRGLVLTAAARRLTTGRAVGIDIWQTKDQTGNDPRATRANAAVEGVADKVVVQSADMRALPFRDATFDVVLSSIAIHNVPGAIDRERTVREIARVLKPGGRVALQDIGHTAEYARVLATCGLRNVTRSGLRFAIVPPVRVVHAMR